MTERVVFTSSSAQTRLEQQKQGTPGAAPKVTPPAANRPQNTNSPAQAKPAPAPAAKPNPTPANNPQAEQKRQEAQARQEQRRQEEEKRKAEDQKRQAEQKKRQEEEQKRQTDQKRQVDQKQQAQKRQDDEKRRQEQQLIQELEDKKAAELELAEAILAETDEICLNTENVLIDIGEVENALKLTLAEIEKEREQINLLEQQRADIEGLINIKQTQAAAKEHHHQQVEEDLGVEIETNPEQSNAEAVSDMRNVQAGQKDFRHLLKKTGPGSGTTTTAAAPPPEKKSTELDQKDFRNLLKKRN